MNADLIVFYILSAVTVIGALGVVLDRNVVRATLMLLIALLGVAGIFLTAFAEFLALAQILLYGGAVTIVVLFSIMLTRTGDLRINLDNPQRPLAAVIAISAFVLLTLTFTYSDIDGQWAQGHRRVPEGAPAPAGPLYGLPGAHVGRGKGRAVLYRLHGLR